MGRQEVQRLVFELPDLTPRARIIVFTYDADFGGFWVNRDENGMDNISDRLLEEVGQLRFKTMTVREYRRHLSASWFSASRRQ
jgi:hypothetical protein